MLLALQLLGWSGLCCAVLFYAPLGDVAQQDDGQIFRVRWRGVTYRIIEAKRSNDLGAMAARNTDRLIVVVGRQRPPRLVKS